MLHPDPAQRSRRRTRSFFPASAAGAPAATALASGFAPVRAAGFALVRASGFAPVLVSGFALVLVSGFALVLASGFALVLAAGPAPPPAGSAERLAARQAALAPRLALQQPVIESSEGPQRARAEVYALLPHAWPTLAAALREPQQWCDALLPHVYVRRCTAGADTLTLQVVTRADAPTDQAEALPLFFRVSTEAGYLKAALNAEHGPLGLRDLNIVFEAIPAGASASFVHFSYQAGTSTVGGWVMQAYLATRGRDKVGFSAAEGEAPGTIRGTRGVVERNAMRYHLALAAYLDSLARPEAERAEYRLGAWFDATERYPRQLHETEREAYLAMKRRDLPAAGR